MTEVPEHLLARAREARERLTGEEGDDASTPDSAAAAPTDAEATPSPAAPVPVAAGDVVPAEPEPPAPVAPFVAAARGRKTVPYWIVPVLLFIPIWAIYYVGLLEPPPAEEGGLLNEGAEVYAVSAGCAGCHGGSGAGGTGRQLNDGEVLLTFPSGEDGAPFDGLAHQISWVVNGTGGTQALGLAVYGDPAREGGGRETGSFGNMGGNQSLSVEELLAVVHYERVTHGGLTGEAEVLELEVLEEFTLLAEGSGLVWDAQSPDDIAELLTEARAELGVEGGEAAAE